MSGGSKSVLSGCILYTSMADPVHFLGKSGCTFEKKDL